MYEIRKKLMDQLDLSGELKDEELLSLIDGLLLGAEQEKKMSVKQKLSLRRELFYSIRKLDVLQELMEDESITEIMVNGPDHIYIERDGRLFRWEKSFSSKEKLEDVIQQIVGRCNRVINESTPMVDARLDDGTRIHAVIAPVAMQGPILTIRRFSRDPIHMERLIRMGSITEECAGFLMKLVRARYSILIGGGTGSGKTTFLSALSEGIDPEERIITIEDTLELRIQGVENLVRLEAKHSNVGTGPTISIKDLIRGALRMRPDRIIVGEVRGGECVDMLQALNTGHEGSMSTAHANTTKDMLSRLETMALQGMNLPLDAIRRQIASGVDILVHLGRLRDKSRKVLEVAEICGMQNGEIQLRTLFQWKEEKGLSFIQPLQHKEKLRIAGLEYDPGL